MEQSLRALKDFVERALRLLDGLVVFIPGDVLLGKGRVDGFESLGEGLHLLFDLPLFFLLLVDQVLNLLLLPVDGVHHLDQLRVGVVQVHAPLRCHATYNFE